MQYNYEKRKKSKYNYNTTSHENKERGWESVVCLFFIRKTFTIVLFFSFVRLIICPSNFLLPCLFGRHLRSHHGGEARLIMPRAIWFSTVFSLKKVGISFQVLAPNLENALNWICSFECLM